VSWLRAQWVDQLTNAVGQATSPVIELALASKDSQRFRGRASVATWNCAAFNAPLVVRRCSHGGFWRHFAGDRYVGDHRARIEIEHSQRILKFGIATPEVVGVVFYKSGLFQRMDLLTVQVPNSVDLVAFLASRPTAHRREVALAAVRDLLTQCAAHGLLHNDLNARNILLANVGDGLRAYVLDVEDVAWAPQRVEYVRAANHARLARSLHKRVRKGDIDMTPQQVLALISELESHA
jgi:tRNA A-37 threonylcarbamoyl transferase component Bud32